MRLRTRRTALALEDQGVPGSQFQHATRFGDATFHGIPDTLVVPTEAEDAPLLPADTTGGRAADHGLDTAVQWWHNFVLGWAAQSWGYDNDEARRGDPVVVS